MYLVIDAVHLSIYLCIYLFIYSSVHLFIYLSIFLLIFIYLINSNLFRISGNPFGALGLVSTRTPKYDLRMFAENYLVKSIGKCVYNSLWVGRCFGKEALKKIKSEAVICSGSTLGSYQSIHFYVRTMLASMDTVKCWLKGIESDQGYQNYLFYNGHFNTDQGNATLFYQGEGVVNTIGALNGFR